MIFSTLLILASWGLFSSASVSPSVEEAYKAVLSVVAPGQQHLTGESLDSLFNTLEKRVQCGGVSCENVSLLGLTRSQVRERQVADCRCSGVRSRSNSY